jgi:hypothetical protein
MYKEQKCSLSKNTVGKLLQNSWHAIRRCKAVDIACLLNFVLYTKLAKSKIVHF